MDKLIIVMILVWAWSTGGPLGAIIVAFGSYGAVMCSSGPRATTDQKVQHGINCAIAGMFVLYGIPVLMFYGTWDGMYWAAFFWILISLLLPSQNRRDLAQLSKNWDKNQKNKSKKEGLPRTRI